VELRKRNLPESASVLDLFCGTGQIYRSVYEGQVQDYHGVDHKQIHDPKLCTLQNNNVYIQTHDLGRYNVFDLDDYGCPWKELHMVMAKAKQPEITLFVTDYLILREKLRQTVSKIVSAIEQVPRHMNIPGLNRWYVDSFGTMLRGIERRYGYQAVKAQYFPNAKETVYYWYILLRKNEDAEAKKETQDKFKNDHNSQR
jgi:hypothetical protein